MSKRAQRTKTAPQLARPPGQTAANGPSPSGPSRIARSDIPAPGRTAFVATIALSAFVMFTLELMGGRLVLPVFGGSANVWTTALVLFTGLLFVGYLYAHLVATHLSPSMGGLLHLSLSAVAIAIFTVAPSDVAALRVPAMPEALNVILALLLIAGAPMLVFASTTPLLSSWYAARGNDPWWLYAVSNLASFAALFVYPLLIEPTIPLSLQRTLVLGGLVLYAVGIGVIVIGGRIATAVAAQPSKRTRRPKAPKPAVDIAAVGPERLTMGRQARWLAAAFVTSGLLAATTNFIATDLVSAPLVWVGPLAIYLASFVVAFSAQGRRILKPVELLVPAAATLLWIPFVLATGLSVWLMLGIEFGGYAVLAIALHGRMALDRPSEAHLTRFYLIISAAGLLATAFVALVAPLIFDQIWEYPLLVIAAIVTLGLLPGPSVWASDDRPKGPRVWRGPWARARLVGFGRDAGIAVAPYVAVLALVWLSIAGGTGFGDATWPFVAGGITIVVGRTPTLFAIATASAIVLFTMVLAIPVETRVRTFYGVTEIYARGEDAYAEYHGTTLHGLQYRDERSSVPTTYYVAAGPIGDVFNDVRTRVGPATIGIVGLGTGTLASYSVPGDDLTYFEIDPAIVDLATSGTWFTYLADAPVEPRVVGGDARLSLQAEPQRTYDLLVFDAFSSDAIPAHLLTREAMAMFAQKLKPDGLMAFHLSNRYYDLPPAVTASANAAGLDAADLSYQPGPARIAEIAAQASEWVVVGLPEAIDRFLPLGWTRRPPGVVLTDDFSDVMRTLR